jgi:MFS family permease
VIVRAFRSNPYGWTVVGLCFGALCMIYAARSTLGLMMPFWETEPGWSRPFASSAGALALALMACSSPFAGNLLDRIGPRWILAGGLLCVAAGALLTSQAEAEWELILYYSIFVGIGSGTVALPLVSTTVALFFTDKQRGPATGIGFSGATGGQLAALPVLGLLVTTIGWRETYVVLGVVIVGLAVVAWQLVGNRPRPSLAREPAPVAVPDGIGARLGSLAGNRTFLLLLGGFVICGFTTAGVIEVHLLPYAAICGFAPLEGATAYGVHGAFNLLGVIIFGFLTERAHRPRLLGTLYFVRALLFVLLMYVGDSLMLLFVFAALFGFLNFATLPPIASLVASQIGVRIMGLTMGLIFAGHWAGAAVGAHFGGEIYRLTARYDGLWLVSVALALLAALLSYLVREDRAPPATLRPIAVPS